MSADGAFGEESAGVSPRERVFARVSGTGEGRRSLAAVLLALAAFGMVLSTSAWQVTGESTALPMLRAAIASLTDIDAFIAEHGPALREEAARAEGPLEPAGYALPIVLEAREVRTATDAQLRTMLLDRSAALVYAEGLGAFDRTGDQRVDRLSMMGLLELGAGQLSGPLHTRAGLAAAALAVATALLAALLASLGEGWSRMRAPAAAIALGGTGAAAFCLALWAIAGQVGGSDPFVADLRMIAQAGLTAGTRNGAIVTAAGLAVVAASWALELVERRGFARAEAAESEALPAAYFDEERDAG